MIMKYALGLALASVTLTYFFGVTRALVALATLAAGLCVFVLKTTSVDVTSMFMLLLVMGLPAFVAGAGVGVAAGLAFRARSHLIGLLCFLPIILVIGSEYYVAEKQVREEKLALAFVTKNAQLQKLVGGAVEVSQVSASKYSDPDNDAVFSSATSKQTASCWLADKVLKSAAKAALVAISEKRRAKVVFLKVIRISWLVSTYSKWTESTKIGRGL
ncbi:MAG: hypothetical protein Q7U16_06965 [Agitococcus sp.]|nr:hypothetical protein [Agitococcus sp.]